MNNMYKNQRNNTQAKLIDQIDDKVVLEFNDGSTQMIKQSTFKRWWKKVRVIKSKHYERNQAPLWHAKIKDDTLLLLNDKDEVLTTLKRSPSRIVVRQKSGAFRYLKPNYNVILEHVCYNQDIRTRKSIAQTYDKWFNIPKKCEISHS